MRCLFYGLGSDGTVGANKNSIKIIGEDTPNSAQGYFVYDFKKSGATTVSHLRFGPTEIHQPYLIESATFIAVHQSVFLERYDVLAKATPGAVFLLNTYYPKDQVWDNLPRAYQEHLINKKMKFYVIDAYDVAEKTGMGGRINTVMQACFFAISGVLPADEAIAAIKESIKKTYGKRGEKVVQQNYQAVDDTLANLHEVPVPDKVTSTIELPPAVPAEAPEFVQKVTAEIIAGRGDLLPVSAMPIDGTYPTATSQWEKRNLALEIPIWDPDVCIQCGKCALVCPHATIRIKVFPQDDLVGAPESFRSTPYKGKEYPGWMYSIQVAPEDCTGCGACVYICPAKNKREPRFKAINMEPQPPLRQREVENYDFFLGIPDVDRRNVNMKLVKTNQLLRPLFEYSGACSGCGETPYIKLVTQLFGDRTIVANATGCSSIYSGNLPTTPYAQDHNGRGPAWSNSLFEDNAEFGLGMRLTLDKRLEYAQELLKAHADAIGQDLVDGLLTADQSEETGIYEQRDRVIELRKRLAAANGSPALKHLADIADVLVRKTVWIFGGDGWAYDIGYGGLDHVMASGTQRQHPGAGHRSVFQHRRPDVQVDPARRGGQVRGRRQADAQEGPGDDGHDLRQRVRRQGRHGFERCADGAGLYRGRVLRRAQHHHRLQPLHRPRHQHDHGQRSAEESRGQRLLAADALRSAPGNPRAEPVAARLQGAQDPAAGLHLQRDPLHDADQVQPAGSRRSSGPGPGRRQQPLAPV